MNPLENRQRMVELMFEAFCVPYAYVAMQAVLALYAAGKTTGTLRLQAVCHSLNLLLEISNGSFYSSGVSTVLLVQLTFLGTNAIA